MSTITLSPVAWAVIDRLEPDANLHPGTFGGDKACLLKYDNSALRSVDITAWTFNVTGVSGFSSTGPFYYVYDVEPFEANTATWATTVKSGLGYQCHIYNGNNAITPTYSYGGIPYYMPYFGFYPGESYSGGSINTPGNGGFKLNISYSAATASVKLRYLKYSDYYYDFTGKTVDWNKPQNSIFLDWPTSYGYNPYSRTTSRVEISNNGTTIFSANTEDGNITIPANTLKIGNNVVTVTVTFEDGATATNTGTFFVPSMWLHAIGPQSGYLANEKKSNFSWVFWRYTPAYLASESDAVPSTSGGYLQWRNGSSGTINSIALGSGSSKTVPANTFPDTANLQWRLIGVTSPAGDSYAGSSWYTLTTIEATSTAEAIEPVGSIVDGTAPVEFRWAHVIETGTAPTGYSLQYKTSAGGAWQSLASAENTDATSWTAPAGSFDAGDIYWRVQTYNTEGVAGAWSEEAKVSVVRAPDTPGLSVTLMAPRFELRWSGSGQQSYEIKIDGVKYAYVYGTEQRYVYDDYLRDGEHTVAVRVQNSLGLWSDWATAALSIENVPGAEIDLEAVFNLNTVVLSWNNDESFAAYRVYRNGELMRRTNANGFVDIYPLGSVGYSVLGELPDGNYARSRYLSQVISLPCLTITDTLSGASLELPYSDSQMPVTARTATRDGAFIYYAGSELPEYERGEAVTDYFSFACAFMRDDVESISRLEAMLGRIVCLRDQYGNKLFTPFTGIKKSSNLFYVGYSGSLQSIKFDETQNVEL